jgi:hypothetical protein
LLTPEIFTRWRLVAVVISVALVLVPLAVGMPSLVTILIAIAMAAAPPIVPRTMLIVIADDYRLGVVPWSRPVSISVAASVSAAVTIVGVVRFVAALQCEHPEEQGSRPDGSNNLAFH